MRKVNFIPIILAAAIAIVGCHSPPPPHTQASAQTPVTVPSFQPMLMTNLYAQSSPDEPWVCTQTSNDGTWRIDVSETNLAVSRFPGLTGAGWPARAKAGESTQSFPWKARTDWLVFAENNNRVWAYDGDGLLFLFTFSETWNKESWHYIGSGSGPFYGDQGTPVPAEVFSRLPERMRKKVKNHG